MRLLHSPRSWLFANALPQPATSTGSAPGTWPAVYAFFARASSRTSFLQTAGFASSAGSTSISGLAYAGSFPADGARVRASRNVVSMEVSVGRTGRFSEVVVSARVNLSGGLVYHPRHPGEGRP